MYSGQDGNNVVGPGGVGVGSGAPISSGQGMMPNQPIVSGGGDIVLNNSGDQKSKKGLKWAIGIIVGVLILAGVGVGVWWGVFNYKDNQLEDTEVEELGFTDIREELVELFEVNEELARYDVDTLITDYVGGDNDVAVKIRLSLEKLSGATSEYTKNYVDESENFVDLTEEIIGIIDDEDCRRGTMMQLNNCLSSSGQGEIFIGKKRELELSRKRAEYIVEMARKWLKDYSIKEGAYYNDDK